MNNSFPVQALSDQEPQTAALINFKEWRERFVITLLRISTVVGIILIIIIFPTASQSAKILFIASYAILLVITILRTPYLIRAYTLVAVIYAFGLGRILGWGPSVDGSLFLLGFIILSALLFDTRFDIFALGISIVTIFGIAGLDQLGWFRPSLSNASAPVFLDWLVSGGNLSAMGIIVVVAIEQLKNEYARAFQYKERMLQDIIAVGSRLEDGIQARSEQLDARSTQLRSTTTIAHNLAGFESIQEILESVVNSIAREFGYYHVGIYLLDENRKSAFLQASSSITGRQLIGLGLRIDPSMQSAIARAVGQRKSYITPDTESSAFIKDPNFPLTRSRMVLPLIVRHDIIGLLDFHSDQSQAFDLDDVYIFHVLADLVAVSIDNVRLINETKALVMQLQTFTATQTSDTWWKFTSRHIPAYQYTPAGVRPLFSPPKEDAADGGLNIPLTLQGQKIGNIKLLRKRFDSSWTEQEIELIEKVADQVTLALENSRLVDEAQRNAQRDQMIANISSRVRETLDVESVVRTAATELQRVFDLKEAEINIGTPSAKSARTRKSTGTLRLK